MTTLPRPEPIPRGGHDKGSETPDDGTTATAALVIRVRDENDAEAWARLTERYTRLLWAIALSHGLTGGDAEDVVQTTWLRLVERIDGIREPARAGAWLATVARHESLRTVRCRRREVALERLPDPRPGDLTAGARPAPDPACLTAERERLRQVVAAFSALPERCRRLLRLLAAGPSGYAEVAAALGIPVGSVGPTRGRCLATLDRLIGNL